MLSILIRAGDERVVNCINSIKKTAPNSNIIVSVVPDKSLIRKISEFRIKYCVVPRQNGSMTTNRGLELVKTNKVIITDSDTTFDKYCIKILEKALDKYEVVKSNIIFQNDGTLPSKLIAKLRTYFNSVDTKMFTPGLGIQMSIKNLIGGYYFDNNVAWSEDSEFSNRVKEKKVKTYYEKMAIIFHPPVKLSHDLACAFLIGAYKLDKKRIQEIIVNRIRTYSEIYVNFGILTFIYGLLWYMFFDLGKLSKHIGIIGQTIQKYFWKL